MADPVVITRAQVAELLGIAPATLADRVGDLRLRHGFPRAIPGSGGRRYSRALVVGWIDGRPGPAPNSAEELDVGACEAILLERATRWPNG